MIDDFYYTLIDSRTLGHNLRQILVAKIPKGHEGDSNPRTSDLESDTLAPYQQAVIKDGYHEGRLSHPGRTSWVLSARVSDQKLGIRNSDLCYDKFNITFRLVIYWNSTFDLAKYTLPLQPFRVWRIIILKVVFGREVSNMK